VIAALAAVACGRERAVQPDTSAPLLIATPDLEIGLADGPDEYLFGRVFGLAFDTLGRIFVADAQADEIRVFGSDGRFLFRIGRRGAGPGELEGPCCLSFDRQGRLWVRDTGNSRYNAYALGDGGAEYVTSRRMAHGAAGYGVAPTFSAASELIDVGHVPGEVAGELQLTRFFVDSASLVVRKQVIEAPPPDSLGQTHFTRRTDRGTVTFWIHQPFGPSHLVAHSPLGGWAEAVSSRYAIAWHGPVETFEHQITRAAQGPKLSAAEREWGQRYLEDSARRWKVSPRDLPFGVPDRKPPLRALRFDSTGRLWAFLSVPDDSAKRADIYDRDGTLAVTVEWPSEIDLQSGYLGPDAALGMVTDSLGVQRVVRLTFSKEVDS
jgi:hypothetical protein